MNIFHEKSINTLLECHDKYDKEFLLLMIEIDKRIDEFPKQIKLKLESWIKKLCVPVLNKEWKKNRNLHAIQMLDMISCNRIESPYDKFVDEMQSIPLLNKAIVKSKLTPQFGEINFADGDLKIKEFSDKVFKKFIPDEEENKNNLKKNKMILKRNFSGKFKKPEIKNKPEKFNYDQVAPFSFLKKNNQNPYVDHRLINNYAYNREIEQLKKLLINLDAEIRYKDNIILKQNEHKKELLARVNELEVAIEKLIINKDQNKQITKSVEKVLLKNKNF